MKMQDFAAEVRKEIVNFTNTAFPASGNIAISVNSSVSSKIIDIASLHLLPMGIRERLNASGICAIGFTQDGKKDTGMRKQILISPDALLKKFFDMGLLKSK